MHGVFMKIFDTGVMITGASGSGKSETALTLLDRGHALISDDLVAFTKTTDDCILGQCPSKTLYGYLHHRELGLLPITKLFGERSVTSKHNLKLIIQLEKKIAHAQVASELVYGTQKILGIEIITLPLPASAHKNLALLIELSVKNLHLQSHENVDNTAFTTT